MEVIVTKTYIKQYAKCPAHIKEKCRAILLKLEKAENLRDLDNVKKIQGFERNFYRIRIGDYRLGLEEVKPKVIVLTVMERSQIYKKFPPG